MQSARATAQELFGDISDSDEEPQPPPKPKGKTKAPVYNYYTRRLANGHSRQINENKKGSHYIEIKVYKTEEIEHVLPLNRWRHAIVTIKNKINEDSDSWRVLSQLIAATRKDFKDCPPTFVSNYY